MIIGPDFIWLHFPKCGGTSFELAMRELLADREGIQFDEIDDKSGVWHHSIEDRKKADPSFNPEGRRVLACIRRLPAWVLSRVHFEATRSSLVASRDMLTQGFFYEPDGRMNNADTYISKFAGVEKWLRTENLALDVAEAFAINMADAALAFARRRERSTHYVKDLSFWFTRPELERLYEANPRWAETELRIYGSLAYSS